MTDVFIPGNLIRIKDFKFDDGNTRDKYLFVLFRNNEGVYVITSLTTSKNKFNLTANKIGCYHDSRISTYYHFPAKELIGVGDYYFDKETYIFFNGNVRKMDIASLMNYALNDNPFSVTHISTLTKEGLKKLIACATQSKFIPNDIKEQLTNFVASL